MHDQTFKGPLPIMIRSHGNQKPSSSLDVHPFEQPVGGELTTQMPLIRSSFPPEDLLYSTAWKSPLATPPSDMDFKIGDQLIDGIECRFPAALPSRATPFTMGSEHTTDVPRTPPAEGENLAHPRTDNPPVLRVGMKSPQPDTYPIGIPVRSAPPGETIFMLDSLLTPSWTPIRKRPSTPPRYSPPVKRQRMDIGFVEETLGDEASSDDASQELDRTAATGKPRQFNLNLVVTTGDLVGELGNTQSSLDDTETTKHLANHASQSDRVRHAPNGMCCLFPYWQLGLN
ncbi:hypothetical protein C7999DRAFT_13839 [Corynascus novoguineensis]|uniref:Uncharacterized protein n=1 Tax=Corynascus novoguineensis TaxID=1126955 RepID=A0AAN7HFW5_9PEZI|nr:hypothetical protein C7999DRAFT_13839 [Corynascus novoguineensis]